MSALSGLAFYQLDLHHLYRHLPRQQSQKYTTCVMTQCVFAVQNLYKLGYGPSDIITTVFRVVRNYEMHEYLKLEFLREVGNCQMRISEGVNSKLQMSGLLAKMCIVSEKAS